MSLASRIGRGAAAMVIGSSIIAAPPLTARQIRGQGHGDEQQYLGYRFGSLPTGLASSMSWRAGDGYSMRLVTGGPRDLVWLTKAVAPADGARHEVVAVLALPRLADDEMLAPMVCRFRSVHDPNIVAIAKRRDAEILRDIVHAWRARPADGSFERVDPGAVECDNIDWL